MIRRGLDLHKPQILVYDYSDDLNVFMKAIIYCPECETLRDHTISRYGQGYRCDQCNLWDSSGRFVRPDNEYDYDLTDLDNFISI